MNGGKRLPDILINVGPKETRVVVAENGVPLEYRIERKGARSEIGDVHLGRVKKVVPALDAAFVDIGGPVAGFLAAAEARPDRGATFNARVTPSGVHSHDDSPARPKNQGGGIGQWVREGDAVVVEVIRDAEGGKGPRLARRAEEEAARAGRPPPRRLHEEPGLMLRTLRDWRGPVGRILVDDMAAFGNLKRFCREFRPDLLPKLAHVRDGDALETDGIAERLQELLGSWVALPSGGRINIAETAALVAIDVDTGSDSSAGTFEDTAFRVNSEAATEIARQLRLRDLKGLVVVGFVPLRRAPHRERVLAALKRATAADPAGVAVGGFTRFGLVEMTRRRRSCR